MPDESEPFPQANEASKGEAEKTVSELPEVKRPEGHEATAEATAQRQPAEAAGDGGRADAEEPSEPGNGGRPEEPEGEFFIVGIGASAGGLEALGELIRCLPVDSGMAYIVVQHLAPDHESILTQLLARSSGIPVVTAADGMTVEPNRVHVNPSNTELAIVRGVVHFTKPPKAHGPNLSIDYLFRSLAEDLGRSAIGIVMSGTGTDGTLGLKAIRAAGGFAFAQEPSTAKFDGMPRSAVESGAADYCLPPKEIAQELARIAKRRRARPATRAPESTSDVQQQLTKLFVLIRSKFGNDLTLYKHSTIDRRIERRMTFRKLDRLEDYVRCVQQDPAELQALYKDLLITVTSFFRDPDAFEALKAKVFPQLLEQREPSEPIRIWVPACGTGEEAYSIAMCLLELCEEKGRDQRIQIFGTDIDEDVIQHARRGVYSAQIELDVSPERLKRFFVEKGNEVQVARRLRDLIVFSQQNVIKDAPFSRIDLVSCRNLLIYLQPNAQKKVLRMFHYALNPSGHLLLGTSETVGDTADLFSPVDGKNRLYAKRLVARQAPLDLGLGVSASIDSQRQLAPAPAPARPMVTLQGLADRKVLDLYGPAGVVVNEKFDILQFRGHTGPYLDPLPGTASFNILKVARVELHVPLMRAIHQASSDQVRVTTDVTYQEEGKHCIVEIDIVPLQDPDSKTRCFLVLFRRMPSPIEVPLVSAEQGQTGEALLPLAQRVRELERDQAETNAFLQTTIEERDRTIEELQSANEELQSANEELQSSNEELETAREEMQSINEELTTLNDELNRRMKELSQTNDDLHSVLSDVDHVVIIVGMDLRIRRHTHAAEKLFGLVHEGVGLSLGVIDRFLGPGSLESKVAAVIQSLSTLEAEVLASNQRWYSLKVAPYKSQDHTIRGAILTLVDIDVRKRAMDMTRDVGTYATQFLAAIGHPLLILDRNLRVVWANAPFLSKFQLTSEESVGTPLSMLGARQILEPGLRERLEGVFASASVLRDFELRLRFPDGRVSPVRVGASLIPASPHVSLALLSIEPTEDAAARAEA